MISRKYRSHVVNKKTPINYDDNKTQKYLVKYDLRTVFFSAQTSTSSGNPSTTKFKVPIFAIIFFLNTF